MKGNHTSMKPFQPLQLLRDAIGTDLDLSAWTHGRYSHLGGSDLAILAWGLLTNPTQPTRMVIPDQLPARRALGRTGVLFAAMKRGIPVVLDGAEVGVGAALGHVDYADTPTLPGFDWKRLDGLLVADDGSVVDRVTRLRVIADLEDPARRPPQPNAKGRRYLWIDNLGAASGFDRRRFNGDADQVLYEAIDNVHTWSRASKALACCAVTRGGGDDSWNRFHVVVIDDGISVPTSVQEWRTANGLGPWSDDDAVQRVASDSSVPRIEGLLRLLVQFAQGGRCVEPTDQGQGLHAIGVLTHQWLGTFQWLTSDGHTCAWVGRTGTAAELESGSFEYASSTGTMLHLTLDVRRKPEANTLSTETLAVAELAGV